MKNTYREFTKLRIYKNVSTPRILNLMFCNRLMSMPQLVKNASTVYKYSSRIFTPYLVDYMINQTFCKGLTAGNTLSQTLVQYQKLKKQNINVIIDYCAEGDMKEEDNEAVNDENAALWAKTADTYSQFNDQIISIKITGLIKMKRLKMMNDSVLMIHRFWQQNSQGGQMTGQQAFQGLQKIYDGISDDNFSEYLKNIHNFTGDPKEFKIDEVTFKMNHHPFYLYEPEKNKDFIINLFYPLSESQHRVLLNMKQRLDLICEKSSNNTNNFKILVDAEQSYVQRAIQSVSEQLQARYNKDRLFIVPTLQNYLKNSVQRAKYEVQIAKKRNLYFGAKLVRGAYIVQQSKISKQSNSEFPIVGCFEDTTSNYLESFKIITSAGFQKGQIFVASHNRDTLQQTALIAKQVDTKLKVQFAQLLGLADHLTHKVKDQGYKVYKLLPWAQTKVMIPYMIRRAQQLSQMKYPLEDQYNLLKHELRERYIN